MSLSSTNKSSVIVNEEPVTCIVCLLKHAGMYQEKYATCTSFTGRQQRNR